MSLAERLPQPLWRHAEFARGARDMVGVSHGIAAWGLVTGVAMAKSSLPLSLALLMSLIVFAGSAQLAVLPLMAGGAPIEVVWATALCVNLRFIIFSAGWRPYVAHLPFCQRLRMGYVTADLNYAIFLRRFPQPRPSPAQRPPFLGRRGRQLAGLAGAFVGRHLAGRPHSIVLGPGVRRPLALLGLRYALVADRATLVAAAVAGCAAVATYALPLKLHILVAIASAVAIGLLMDHGTPRRVAPEDDLT